MKSVDFLSKIHQQINEDFQSQNPELFDTVFEIEGKKLYAHKYWLSVASTTFKLMLSERWNSNNDAIKIEVYKYDDFKEFLTFIYSGKCNLNNSNIATMVDMAEFYQIDHFKNFCDDFATKIQIDLTNVFEFMRFSNKYSLAQMKKMTENFIAQNFANLVKSDEFFKADKCGIAEIVKIKSDETKPEEVFQAVYQWAEYQANLKQSTSLNKNLSDAIKAEISDFLPYFEFPKMKLTFLHEFVVRKGFLFSYEELSDILENANIAKWCSVKVTNTNGQTLSGFLPFDSNAVKIIKSLKNVPSNNPLGQYNSWKSEVKNPPLYYRVFSKKKNGFQWYLLYDYKGDITLQKFSNVNFEDFFIAELTADNEEFNFTFNCTIEIC